MQQILLPAIGTVTAAGTAMLVGGGWPVAIGAGIGCGIGVWIAQKRQASKG